MRWSRGARGVGGGTRRRRAVGSVGLAGRRRRRQGRRSVDAKGHERGREQACLLASSSLRSERIFPAAATWRRRAASSRRRAEEADVRSISALSQSSAWRAVSRPPPKGGASARLVRAGQSRAAERLDGRGAASSRAWASSPLRRGPEQSWKRLSRVES